MRIIFDSLLILHFIGLAALLGGFMTQARGLRDGTARIDTGILHGGYTMGATGLLMVALGIADAHIVGALAVAKYTVKLVLLAALLVIAIVYRKREPVPAAALIAIGALALADIVVAVVWP